MSKSPVQEQLDRIEAKLDALTQPQMVIRERPWWDRLFGPPDPPPGIGGEGEQAAGSSGRPPED